MVFWAKELIELAKQISDKMESIDVPKDENGKAIYGTDELRKFNKYALALMGCNGWLKKLLEEDTNEN